MSKIIKNLYTVEKNYYEKIINYNIKKMKIMPCFQMVFIQLK